jgi:hypothetical protein
MTDAYDAESDIIAANSLALAEGAVVAWLQINQMTATACFEHVFAAQFWCTWDSQDDHVCPLYCFLISMHSRILLLLLQLRNLRRADIASPV